jgi:hypothetical protein
MNENKGLLASLCGFFKSLFSSSPAVDNKPSNAANDGLTGVERYIRNQSQGGSTLTSVENYIRNKATNSKPQTGVDRYINSRSQAKPTTGVERYIQSKG